MPTITSGISQTLTTVDSTVTVRIQYNVTFSVLDRFLAANGLRFQESITVGGVDAPSSVDTVLTTFPAETIPVSAGTTPLTVPRVRTISVSRATLQEDPAFGDTDEIRCKVQIKPVGMPADLSGISNTGLLYG